MLLTHFDTPITATTYAFARAAVIAEAFRDRIEQIPADTPDLEDDLNEAFNLLDDIAFRCTERAFHGGAEASEVADLYTSDTIHILMKALAEADDYEFRQEIEQLETVAALIARLTTVERIAA
jgi:hypothetical protein